MRNQERERDRGRERGRWEREIIHNGLYFFFGAVNLQAEQRLAVLYCQVSPQEKGRGKGSAPGGEGGIINHVSHNIAVPTNLRHLFNKVDAGKKE